MSFCGCIVLVCLFVLLCVWVWSEVCLPLEALGPSALSCNETELCRVCVSHLKGLSRGLILCLIVIFSLCWPCVVEDVCCVCLRCPHLFFISVFLLTSVCRVFVFMFIFSVSQEPRSECILLWFSTETQYVSTFPVRPCFWLLPVWYANMHTHTLLHRTQSYMQHQWKPCCSCQFCVTPPLT